MSARSPNERARLPALPPVSTQDSSVRAWMQAVTERLEVREGQRGDSDERAVTQRELMAFMAQPTSTATPASSSDWWTKYRNISELADALRDTTMHDDLLRRINHVDSEPIVSTREGATTIVVSSDTSTEVPPDALRLVRNGLDFYRLPTVTSRVESTYQEFVCTVNTAGFFAAGGNHIVFALDCAGEAGNGGPHFGKIIRNGQNLFEFARGFIVFGDGSVYAEHWNGTGSPGLSPVVSTAGAFNPITSPIFTVRISAGYRSGAMANYMAINIHKGGASGPIMFSGTAQFGWNWSGRHVAYIGAIGPGFKSPNETGFVERLDPGLAPSATINFSGAKLTIA